MEREFKWQIANPADFDRIAESDAVQPLVQSSGTTEMEAIYLDGSFILCSSIHPLHKRRRR